MLQSVETRTFMGLEKSDQHPYDRQMRMIKTILAVAKPEHKNASRGNNRASQNMDRNPILARFAASLYKRFAAGNIDGHDLNIESEVEN